MKPEKLSKLRFREGEEVIFTKSMRRVKVIKNEGNGFYTVERIDNGKRLSATFEGLRTPSEALEEFGAEI
jgi:hypothetical protein